MTSWEPIARETVEATAQVAGPDSAAAQALTLADTLQAPQFFRRGAAIVVVEMERENA